MLSSVTDKRFPENDFGCFAAGTPIWTDRGQLPIEQIKVGDMVLSRPEAGGEPAFKRVTKTFCHEDKKIWRLEYYLTKEEKWAEMFVTPNHPIWVRGTGWSSVESITDGSTMVLQDGSDAIYNQAGLVWATGIEGVGYWYSPWTDDTSQGFGIDFRATLKPIFDDSEVYRSFEAAQPDPYLCAVYNIEVEDFHTYYAGESGLWVHNTNCAKRVPEPAIPSIYRAVLTDPARGVLPGTEVPRLLASEINGRYTNPGGVKGVRVELNSPAP